MDNLDLDLDLNKEGDNSYDDGSYHPPHWA